MTLPRAIELAVAVLIIVGGVVLYRRPRADKSDSYGSQGAVLLFAAGAIVAIHALRLMDYRPGKAHVEMLREQAQ